MIKNTFKLYDSLLKQSYLLNFYWGQIEIFGKFEDQNANFEKL